ncbi:MAG: hypothetical protein V1875_00015 [Candidatus Altiarchaeota archaeon]
MLTKQYSHGNGPLLEEDEEAELQLELVKLLEDEELDPLVPDEVPLVPELVPLEPEEVALVAELVPLELDDVPLVTELVALLVEVPLVPELVRLLDEVPLMPELVPLELDEVPLVAELVTLELDEVGTLVIDDDDELELPRGISQVQSQWFGSRHVVSVTTFSHNATRK